MIAGRLRWREPGQKAGVGSKLLLAVFEFPNGTLLLTEASSKKRASMQLVARLRRPAIARSRRGRTARRDTGRVPRRAHAREPHAEAGAHRSASLQRHRQRVLGRDSPRRAPVAAQADAARCRTRKSHACIRPRARRFGLGGPTGPRAGRRGFPRRSPRFATGWPSTAASGSRARCAARRCSGSSTPTTSATTARGARRAAGCWRTARCRVCSAPIGRKRLTISNQYM